jgi:ketosteroid isomerase-like protein
MSQENIDAVRRFYDAWSRGELPGPSDLMDDRIEYVNPPGAVEPGTRRGLVQFGRAVERVFETYDKWEIEPEQFRAVGDQVAVVARWRARVGGSGVNVEARESALWTFEGGRVIRYAWFQGPDEALEAAGLSE